jgi:N-acetylmuramoyl-L-alanine amidase
MDVMGIKRLSLLLAVAAVAAGCRGSSVDLERQRSIAAVDPTTTTLSPTYRGAAATPSGVVVPVLGKSADGWSVGTPCGRTATVQSVKALTGRVVLDAGHGGIETGAVGRLGNKESDLNEAVTEHARRALETAGIPVVLTRTDDYRIGLAPRASIVKAVDPDAVVSIHHNASYGEYQATPGTEVFHQGVGPSAAASRRLAGLLYEEVTATLARYGLPEWAATKMAGVKPRLNSEGDDFYGILRRTKGSPTALLEVGFVSHRDEERLYTRPDVQQAIGEAVARAVVRFLSTKDPGRGFISPPRLADDGHNGGGTQNCEDPRLG